MKRLTKQKRHILLHDNHNHDQISPKLIHILLSKPQQLHPGHGATPTKNRDIMNGYVWERVKRWNSSSVVERGIAGPKVTGSIPVCSFFSMKHRYFVLIPVIIQEMGDFLRFIRV